MRPGYRLFPAAALALAVGLALPAAAEDAGRYALSASRDGFVRLDTATGAVSHCVPEKGVWRCQPLPAEDAVIDARLDALASLVARLTTQVAALDARVAAIAPIASAAQTAPPAPQPEGPGFLRQTVDRFLAVVRTLKHGRAAVTPAES